LQNVYVAKEKTRAWFSSFIPSYISMRCLRFAFSVVPKKKKDYISFAGRIKSRSTAGPRIKMNSLVIIRFIVGNREVKDLRANSKGERGPIFFFSKE
jgi:hypothetical protein